MAIYTSVPPPAQQATAYPQAPLATSTSSIDIENWTASTFQSLSVSPYAHGTGVSLSTPLGEAHDEATEARRTAYKERKEPLRRDSLKRRDSFLKGNLGSRRRQRSSPARPKCSTPLPSDWEVHPTYPVHTVPYYLAPLWDAGVRHRAEEIAAAKKSGLAKRAGIEENGKGRVPSDLRNKLKKSKGAKTLLQDLEEEVRKFVRDYERKERMREQGKEERLEPEIDSEDEEIVFIGRNGTMSDEQRKTVEEELEREKKVYEAELGAPSAGFARWLVHSIAQYYGLTSRSVTVNGVRREAWVGIREMKIKTGERQGFVQSELPRPLWGMI